MWIHQLKFYSISPLSIFGPFHRAKVECDFSRTIVLQRKDLIFHSCKNAALLKTGQNRTYKSACGEIFSAREHKSWDDNLVMGCLYWQGWARAMAMAMAMAMARPKCDEAITELHPDSWIAFLHPCTSQNWSSCFLYQIDKQNTILGTYDMIWYAKFLKYKSWLPNIQIWQKSWARNPIMILKLQQESIITIGIDWKWINMARLPLMPHHSNEEDSVFAPMIETSLLFRCISAKVETHMRGNACCTTNIKKPGSNLIYQKWKKN